MTLWEWAVGAWAKPRMRAALLGLQDDHGQRVPLLLWALWLAETGRTPDPATIDRAVAASRTDAIAIERLRAARRIAAPDDRRVLLERELQAERRLLDRLEAIQPTGAKAFVEPAAALAVLSARWGLPLDPFDFETLVGAPADVR